MKAHTGWYLVDELKHVLYMNQMKKKCWVPGGGVKRPIVDGLPTAAAVQLLLLLTRSGFGTRTSPRNGSSR